MSLSRLARLLPTLTLALLSSVAHADDKAACIAASDAGQTARDAKKLEEARRAFVTCAGQTCPKAIQTSCDQWLREVVGLQPTVVFRAVDSKGNDLVAVKVLLDGNEVQASMTGKAIAIDPGPHKISFQHAKLAPVEQSVVIAEGQKGRAITAEFKPEPPAHVTAPPAAASSTPVSTPPPEETPRSGGSPLPYVVGGVGVVSLIASGVFFLSYTSKRSALSDACKTNTTCPPAQQENIDGANRSGTISVITGVVGVAALGVGTWMLLSNRGAPPATAASVGVSSDGRPFAVMSHSF